MAASVVSTIYTLIKFIYQWQQEYKDSKNALGTMVSTVSLVERVIQGINVTLYSSLETPMRALMDCLSETKDMLIANGKKKGVIMQFLFPGNVIEQMQLVESRIHKLIAIMTLAVSATNLNNLPPATKPTAMDFITNEETKKFWKSAFGENVYSVKWIDLEKALMSRYTEFVDAESLSDLHLQLDNLNTGFISCHRLSDFCKDESLSTRLQAYTQNKPQKSVPLSASAENLKFPLLLWVDDNPANNRAEIEYATNRGINVVVLNSTSEAKQWIVKNPQLLEEDNPNRFRIITDNAREGAGTSLDINAGEDMIRFVRGRRSKVPILVYCGNLEYTKYTRDYKECEATVKQGECFQFINFLTSS
eukprot:Phypoly_transcript_11144.p1 GENE.Phypoly_transcript_11144~~Phypoly_transcript_11144.p1  ORF type:complete len:391 (+),score=48.97 Phypoly_transcript_11144:89-1174(+)